MTPLLEVTGLRKSFGDLRVLEGIDLSIRERGVHAIIGPNGAGKTTLFNCICGELRPDAGTVTLNGRDITNLAVVPRVRLGLARTFQLNRVFESMSAAENIELALLKTRLRSRLGLRRSRSERRAIETRRRELLDEVSLPAALQDRIAGEISHADRRAVEVAMALACDPIVLCLDEPTAGIGVGEAERLAGLIGQLAERVAIVLVEHRMSLVQRVADEVSVLAYGSMLAHGTAAEVSADPRVQDAYLGRRGSGPSPSASSPPTSRPIRSPVTAGVDAARPGSHVPAPGLLLRDVHSYYGSSHVLHGIDLVAREGEVSSILGRNGAGKTTTLKSVMNLVEARSGSIRLGDRELIGLPTHAVAALGIALVPEERWVFGELTVEENLRVAGGSGAQLEEAYAEFPALAERRRARGSQLSGGQQQMLAFARALVQAPSVVLLDEPTQGLSPQYVEVVVGYVRRLRERRITVVLVEQNLDVVAAVSDTVYLMSDGRIGAELPTDQLASAGPLIQQYLLLDSPADGTQAPQQARRDQQGAAVA
jgi:branched-chain amino acid transport system ATP-binding protein